VRQAVERLAGLAFAGLGVASAKPGVHQFGACLG
jgi:hypothetical protein